MNLGVGIGYRRDIADIITSRSAIKPDFIELAPENWMGMGGYWGKKLRAAAEVFPLTAHGLSLSIGAPDELDFDFLKRIKAFIKEHNIQIYSEHLSYCQCDNAHLYELLPIPFTEEAVKHIAKKIKQVQDYLEMPLTLENVSYYTAVGPEMKESEFISAIVEESKCQLLLDVNNVYVNAFNHNYNPHEFILDLPLHAVKYIHMAGHTQVSDDTIIDTHGENIIAPVFDLFDWTLEHINPCSVLLERDFNIPEADQLNYELNTLKEIANHKWTAHEIKYA